MKYFVYILQCADNTYYIGYTNDVEKRIHSHNNLKSAAKYTKVRRPVILKYTEEYATLSLALKREHHLKKLNRAEKEKLWSTSYNVAAQTVRRDYKK